MYDAYFISVKVACVNGNISGSFKLLITIIICVIYCWKIILASEPESNNNSHLPPFKLITF